MSQNWAMLMTPPGSGAIAVVRLKGPRVEPFLSTHLSRSAAVGRCIHCDLRDGDNVLDDVIVALVDEQSADLNLHASPWIIQRVLEMAATGGFEVVQSSSLPLPVWAVDGAGELEREVLTHLPLARTELGVRVLLAQVAAWESLKRRIAEGEDNRSELESILRDRTALALLYPKTIAIIGPANAGKSTLANQLFGQERSITADVPGTTRDWVGEMANINGLPVMLVDTPGIRATSDEIERQAIERSSHVVRQADLVVLVIDISRPLEGEQRELMDRYPDAMRVANKWDRHKEDAPAGAIKTIAVTGEGVELLRRAILRSFCGAEEIVIHQARWWTSRQKGIIEGAIEDPAKLAEL